MARKLLTGPCDTPGLRHPFRHPPVRRAGKAAPHPISGSGIEQAASPGAESRALCSEPGLHQDQPLTPSMARRPATPHGWI
ncbi:unnamed protein product [Caretta caretta]